MYVPTLVEVPTAIPLRQYKSYYGRGKVPVLDQGAEGACTGYGLAAVAQFLLRRRQVVSDSTPVSPDHAVWHGAPLVRRAQLGISSWVQVPGEQGLTSHSYRVLQLKG